MLGLTLYGYHLEIPLLIKGSPIFIFHWALKWRPLLDYKFCEDRFKICFAHPCTPGPSKEKGQKSYWIDRRMQMAGNADTLGTGTHALAQEYPGWE